MTELVEYHFEQRDDNEWIVYPNYGGGDILLSPEVIEKELMPKLKGLRQVTEANREFMHESEIGTDYGNIKGNLRLHFYGYTIHTAKVQFGNYNAFGDTHNVKRFKLSLPLIEAPVSTEA